MGVVQMSLKSLKAIKFKKYRLVEQYKGTLIDVYV